MTVKYTKNALASGAVITKAALDNMENTLAGLALASLSVVNVQAANPSALGDGTTNDTAAVQAAFDALPASGGVVVFPSGQYLVDTIYCSKSNVRVKGDGIGRTIIKRRAGTNVDARVFAFNSTGPTNTAAVGSYLSNITVEHLTIDGNNGNVTSGQGSATVCGALFFGNVKFASANHVYVKDPRELGIHFLGCIDSEMIDCTTEGMRGTYQVNPLQVTGDIGTGTGTIASTPNQYPSTRIKIRGCKVLASASYTSTYIGVCIQGSTYVDVIDTVVDLSADTAARAIAGQIGIMVEGGGQSGQILQSKHIKIVNCTAIAVSEGMGCIDSNGGQGTTGILDDVVVANCQVIGALTGIQINGTNHTVIGNHVTADVCIALGTQSKNSVEGGYTVVGNRLYPTKNCAITTAKQYADGALSDVTIQGNFIDGALQTNPYTGTGLLVQGYLYGWSFANNLVRNTISAAVFMVWDSSNPTWQARDGEVAGNKFRGIVRSASGGGAYLAGVGSQGSQDVRVRNNTYTPGASMSTNFTISLNSLPMYVSRNRGPNNAVAADSGSTADTGA